MLVIEGQNSEYAKDLTLSKNEFMAFIQRHEKNNPIAECNDAMFESYVMVVPLGRFFQNSGSIYDYSMPILEVGVPTAFNQITFKHQKFIDRGGVYVL